MNGISCYNHGWENGRNYYLNMEDKILNPLE